MSTQMPTDPNTRNRLYLLLIFALFVAPLTLAWLLVDKWRPGGAVNHGELLDPPRQVSQLQLHLPTGGNVDGAFWRGRWTLVYLGVPCDERCRQGLYNIRQVRLALGKDMQRAQTLFIMAGAPEAALLPWLKQEHPTLTAGVADKQTLDLFTQAFAGDTAVAPGEWIYLVDPLGNLFMRYRLSADPVTNKGILTDLQRVLKYSTLG